MTTPLTPPLPDPELPKSDQTRELLKFLREESAASRNAVREDADASRKLLVDSVKLVSIPFVIILAVAGFLGFKSISDVKRDIRSEANRESQKEISRMQAEIRSRLDDQFRTPALKDMVIEAAKQSTKSAAEPLIKSEVEKQVRARVDAEKPAIAAAVIQQSQASVKEMGSQLDSLVKKSVDTKISTAVDPVIKQIKDEAELQSLIMRMNSDDALAFDTLVNRPLATLDPGQRNVIIGALRTAYGSHNSGMFQTRGFNERQSEDQLIAHLSDSDSYSREAALDSLSEKQKISLLPKIVAMMRSDPSINVRCAAYRIFNSATAQKFEFECLDPSKALSWWESNKQNFRPVP